MSNALETNPLQDKALVVFTNNTDLPWLRILKPGYRHCFAVVQKGDYWVTYEPLCHRTHFDVFSGMETQEIITRFQELGLIVVETRIMIPQPKLAPIGPYSCVEAIKRILGVHKRLVFTPWQLFTYLDNQNKSLFDLIK